MSFTTEAEANVNYASQRSPSSAFYRTSDPRVSPETGPGDSSHEAKILIPDREHRLSVAG